MLQEEKCSALVVDVVWDVLVAEWSHRNCVSTQVTFSDQSMLRLSVEASSYAKSLKSEDSSDG